jgi:uncharacterized glyoxalase superfamily protein PhnB
MENRSVPCDTVLPHLVYNDVEAAIEYLTRVFGFTEHYRYGNPAQGAQLLLGRACIMLRTARPDSDSPGALGKWTQSLTVFVDDVDEHYEHARNSGAVIIEALHETEYGERQYGVADPWCHHWLFSRHARDVDPTAWGARVAATEPRP